MNKKIILSVLLAYISMLAQAAGVRITGKTTDPTIKKIYIFSVLDEQNHYITLLDSIDISNGHFTYSNDTLYSQVLFLTPVQSQQAMDIIKSGSYHFFSVGENTVSLAKDKQGKLIVDMGNAKLEKLYQEFHAERYRLANRQVLDSLDALFYAARAKGDTKEMKRIKEYSTPIYDEGMERVDTWQDQQLKETRGTAFGTYLFYTYRLMYAQLKTEEAIRKVRSLLNEYDEEAKQTEYYHKINNKLMVMEKAVVGQKAPAIAGLDRKDKPLSLADFKGKYVLVDFWSSGCTWCRAETPDLKKTYEEFKNDNFTILGVSTDYHKDEWIKAIEEDKAYWNQLILPRDTRNETLKAYSIVAIPEILLVDPHGKIIAKGLRGEEIYHAVKRELRK